MKIETAAESVSVETVLMRRMSQRVWTRYLRSPTKVDGRDWPMEDRKRTRAKYSERKAHLNNDTMRRWYPKKSKLRTDRRNKLGWKEKVKTQTHKHNKRMDTRIRHDQETKKNDNFNRMTRKGTNYFTHAARLYKKTCAHVKRMRRI